MYISICEIGVNRESFGKYYILAKEQNETKMRKKRV